MKRTLSAALTLLANHCLASSDCQLVKQWVTLGQTGVSGTFDISDLITAYRNLIEGTDIYFYTKDGASNVGNTIQLDFGSSKQLGGIFMYQK